MTTEAKACGNDLLYEAQNGIGILTLNRPHRRNATTFAMYNKIKQICARAGTNDDPDMLKVIIFKGAHQKLRFGVSAAAATAYYRCCC